MVTRKTLGNAPKKYDHHELGFLISVDGIAATGPEAVTANNTPSDMPQEARMNNAEIKEILTQALANAQALSYDEAADLATHIRVVLSTHGLEIRERTR